MSDDKNKVQQPTPSEKLVEAGREYTEKRSHVNQLAPSDHVAPAPVSLPPASSEVTVAPAAPPAEQSQTSSE